MSNLYDPGERSHSDCGDGISVVKRKSHFESGMKTASMESRADRMQQRMRGAGHGQIEDVSFQLDLAGDDLSSEIDTQTSPEVPPPRTTPTPNTSAKRRKLDTDAARTLLPPPGSASQASKPDHSELQEGSSTESAQPIVEEQTDPNAVTEEDQPDSVESLPPSRPLANAPPVSPVQRRSIADNSEVEESPADAPGSGRRRTITSSALASSARLQQALSPDENATETVPISSPLERKVRRTTINTRRSTTSSRGSRNSAISATENAQDLSTEAAEKSDDRIISPELSSRSTRPDESAAEAEAEPQSFVERDEQEEQEPSQDHDESVAEEIDAREAAQQLGRKRPRRSPRGPSTEPDSTIADEEQEDPSPKRRKKQSKASPAKQRQGRPKGSSTAKAAAPKAARKRKTKTASDAPGGDEKWTIPVQRFTKKQAIEGHDDGESTLDIPFAKVGGVTTVDVLAAVCDESIQEALQVFKEGVINAEDRASKRELQMQAQALRSFRDELRDRFLHQAVLLDTQHSLRQRLRSVQKERTTLRDEIMRIRSEREQVAIRKDAIRIKHDKIKEEALSQLSLSSQMHDIDLAVERGRAAPELGPAEKKTAELANLELMISRITDQACTKSDTGGTFKQIKDFNAFLERAAVALENR
ncbi:AT hook domain-containing protein [Colletotrichum karsti]|uniref:AT hook domain-containing protein n=1 Tax=Colletotrichum karsti TaxID=1095194 RepID=A0A9P6I454_9PEZI|nr:AT hook domain-containing protein [Colletotrichum karsti]KAF9875694.1 AT hook domain-containing protein [Colletotrichum karsti]